MQEMLEKMSTYNPLGEKNGNYTGYQTLNYCEKLISDYSAEEVENYNTGFMKLFRWFTSIVALRK